MTLSIFSFLLKVRNLSSVFELGAYIVRLHLFLEKSLKTSFCLHRNKTNENNNIGPAPFLKPNANINHPGHRSLSAFVLLLLLIVLRNVLDFDLELGDVQLVVEEEGTHTLTLHKRSPPVHPNDVDDIVGPTNRSKEAIGTSVEL